MAVGERSGVIGGFVAWHEEDRFTEALYLSSEVPARSQVQVTNPLGRFMVDHASSIDDAEGNRAAGPLVDQPVQSSHRHRRGRR